MCLHRSCCQKDGRYALTYAGYTITGSRWRQRDIPISEEAFGKNAHTADLLACHIRRCQCYQYNYFRDKWTLSQGEGIWIWRSCPMYRFTCLHDNTRDPSRELITILWVHPVLYFIPIVTFQQRPASRGEDPARWLVGGSRTRFSLADRKSPSFMIWLLLALHHESYSVLLPLHSSRPDLTSAITFSLRSWSARAPHSSTLHVHCTAPTCTCAALLNSAPSLP